MTKAKQKLKDRAKQWEANQAKAIAMTDKFIDVLQKLDCYSTWSSVLIERMLVREKKDAGVNGYYHCDDIIGTLESTFGFTVIKIGSLAEQYKVDEFLNDLSKNPYQLNLLQN